MNDEISPRIEFNLTEIDQIFPMVKYHLLTFSPSAYHIIVHPPLIKIDRGRAPRRPRPNTDLPSWRSRRQSSASLLHYGDTSWNSKMSSLRGVLMHGLERAYHLKQTHSKKSPLRQHRPTQRVARAASLQTRKETTHGPRMNPKSSHSPASANPGTSYSEHKPKTPPPDLPSLLLDSRIVYIGMPVS